MEVRVCCPCKVGGNCVPTSLSLSATNGNGSAISAVGDSGRWKEALSMMKQMTEDGVMHDRHTYSGAIRACGQGGQWAKALDLLNEMPGKGKYAEPWCDMSPP